MAILAVSLAGAAIGGAIGAATTIGVSLGVSIGWAVGSFIGNALFAPKQTFEGPRLNDLQVTASTDGSPLIVGYGTFRAPCKPIWTTSIIPTRHEEDVGGKGGMFGGGQTSITWTYSIKQVLSAHDGEITGFRRVWMDSKLVFSISENADPATFDANDANGTLRFYTGAADQAASALIASYEGAANTPGFRGTALLELDNWQLKNFANHVPFIEAEIVVSGTKTLPQHTHTITGDSGSGPSFHTIDTRRRLQYSVNHVLNAGDHIWKWDFTSTAPEAIYEFDATLAGFLSYASGDVASIAIDEHENQLVIFNEQLGSVRYARFDMVGYSLIDYGQITLTGITDPASGNVASRDGWFYSVERRTFVTMGDGFSTGNFVVTANPNHSVSSQVTSVDTQGTAISWNKVKIEDSDGNLWFLYGSDLVKAAPASAVYALPSGVSVTTDGMFIWKARNEIWIPRASGHATDGWVVFDISTETFSDSVDLFGTNTWTTDYDVGIENKDGYAWFISIDGAGAATMSQRDSSGTELRSDSSSVTGLTNTLVGIQYITGVIIFFFESGLVSAFYEDALAKGTISLQDVVEDICTRCNLTAAQVNATALSGDTVRGFVIARPMSGRNALEPLQLGYGFDGVESDGTMKFVKRGGASVVTIPQGDMGVQPGGIETEAVAEYSHTRALETELPATIYLKYINQTTDYNIAAEYARRLITDSKNVWETELPLVLTSEEAAQLVDNLLHQFWLERDRYVFSLGPKYMYLDPCDVVTLYDGTRVRIVKMSLDQDGVLTCEAVGDDDAALTSYMTGSVDEWSGDETLTTTSPTVIAVIDGALLDDKLDDLTRWGGLCGETSGWPGGVLMQSKDGGLSWAAAQAFGTATKIGSVTNGSMIHPTSFGTWDQTSEITVRLAQPDLTLSSPSSLLEFYAGANAFFISSDYQNWELCQAYTVVDNGDGTYRLRNFLRGRKGTEHSAAPHRTGARIVFVDSTRISTMPESLSQLGVEDLWRGVTIGGSILDEVSHARTFNAVAATPLAPVEIGGAKTSLGIVINWTPRVRKYGDWTSGEIVLDESPEQYVVSIYDEGFGDLKTTVTVTEATTYFYSNADQTTDFGGTQDRVGVEVKMVSSRVGNGFAGRATVGDKYIATAFDPALATSNVTLSDNDRRALFTGAAQTDFAAANRTFATGKWYWEFYVDFASTIGDYRGGITSRSSFTTGDSGPTTTERMWTTDGSFSSHVSITGSDIGIGMLAEPVVMRFAWDATNGYLWAGINERWGDGSDPATGLNPMATHTPGSWRPLAYAHVVGYTFTIDASFGGGRTRYKPPSGFTRM